MKLVLFICLYVLLGMTTGYALRQIDKDGELKDGERAVPAATWPITVLTVIFAMVAGWIDRG